MNRSQVLKSDGVLKIILFLLMYCRLVSISIDANKNTQNVTRHIFES
jgi:hypothetical protein